MSIINDALKKSMPGIKLATQKGSSKRWLIWAGTAVVSLTLILLVTNSVKNSGQNRKMSPETREGMFPLKEIDFEMPFRGSEFNLTGIVYDQESPMAIINNRILGEGALINGAELIEIQPNYVMLSFRGRELKLKVK